MTTRRMYLTEDEATAMNLPTVADQIERHNRRMEIRRTVRLQTSKDLMAAMTDGQDAVLLDECRAELADRGLLNLQRRNAA